MVRPLFFLIIQRAGAGDGAAVCEAGVNVTLSILARRNFWMFV
jgi:hypothetical protein